MAGALLMSVPCFADTGVGVSIPLTVTVTGGSSGGGGGFNSGTPTRTPTWQELFPSMNQASSSAQIDNRPVQTNPVINIPPVVAQPQQIENIVTPVNDLPEKSKIDWPITILIIIGAAIVVAIIIIVIGECKKRQY